VTAEHLFVHPATAEYSSLLSPTRRTEGRYRPLTLPQYPALFAGILAEPSPPLRDTLMVFAEMFDPPSNPALWLPVLPLMPFVLGQLDPVNAPLHRRATAVFRDLLVDAGLLNRGQLQGHARVQRISNDEWHYPLFTFHLLAATAQYDGERLRHHRGRTVAYKKYALRAHAAFRHVEAYYAESADVKPDIAKDHLYRCGLALRLFLQYLPDPTPGMDQASIEADLERAFDPKRLAKKDRQRQFHKANATAALFGTWERCDAGTRVGDLGGAHTPVVHQPPSIAQPTITWETALLGPPTHGGTLSARLVSPATEIPREALDAGEGVLDWVTDAIEVRGAFARDPRAAQMAALRASQRLHRDVLLFPYAREYVQLPEYASLYERLVGCPFSDLRFGQQAITLFLLLVAHTGSDPATLMDALLDPGAATLVAPDGKVDPGRAADQHLRFDPAGPVLVHPAPRVGYTSAAELVSDPLCRPVSPWVGVPLPSWLVPLMDAYLQSRLQAAGAASDDVGALFLKNEAPPVPLTLEDVEAFLRELGETRPKAMLRRLARSFWPTYVCRAGLDPLIACHVAGSAPRVFATQLFYRHVPAAHLSAAYEAAARQIHALILAECRGLRVSSFVGDDRRDVQRWAPGDVGYGTRILCREDALSPFVTIVRQTLRELAAQESQEARIYYHNGFTTAIYVLLQLRTGVRPMRGGVEAVPDSPHPDRVRVSEKPSPRHVEVRTLRQTPALAAIRTELRRARDVARRLPGFDEAAYQQLGSPLMFFLTAEGAPQRVTPSGVRHRLRDFPALQAAFPFPLNVGRHVLETLLGEAGIHRDVIDYGLGHVRKWREAAGKFSAADLPGLEDSFADRVEQIAARIGLPVIRYGE
jgi:hypothetical protein